MNETIGIKGGHQDKIRTIRIEKKKLEALEKLEEEKENKELEESVKKKQRMTFIKALPIAIAGEVFRVLYDTATGRERIDKQEEYSKWKIKEYDADFTTKARGEKPKKREAIVVLPDGRKVTVVIPIIEEKKEDVIPDVLEEKIEVVEEKKEELTKETPISQDNVIPEYVPVFLEEKKNPVEEKKEVILPVEEVPISLEEEKDPFKEEVDLSPKSRETLQKLKNRKIIDEYEKQLKDIRFELRNLVFEYKVLEQENESIQFSDDAEELLERLSDVIRKIEILKEKIKIDKLEDFDDNYIYTLIEGYLSEFRDQKLIKDIQDSPLYVLISEKIDEVMDRKDQFQKEVDDKKKDFLERENRLDELKEKYYHFDRINKELEDFQLEQERILREVERMVRDAVSVQERVEVQVQAMNRQSRRLLRLMALSMFLPGNRSAKKVAASTAAYMYFARNILHPATTKKKYQVVTVKDYSRDIEYNISAIEDANDLLKRTDKQLDRMIHEIRSDFQDYIGVLPDCDELLSNLEKVKRDLHEKEYEMDKVKKQQELLLEKNNAKVLKRGEYPM